MSAKKIIFHGNCKVQSALNAAVDLSGEERVDLQIIREAAMEFYQVKSTFGT